MTDLFVTIFLLAAIQGVMLSVILFTKKENHSANIVLGIAILALSIDLLYAIYYARNWFLTYPHLMGLAYPFPLLYGPLFYVYAKLVSKQMERPSRRELLHALPLVIVYLFGMRYYFLGAEEKIAFVYTMIHNTPPLLFSITEKFLPLQGILYTILIVRAVTRYNRAIKDSYSNIDRINLTWLKYLAVSMIIIWSFVAVGFFLVDVGFVEERIASILNTLISILIYSIGYMGLKQPEIFMKPLRDADEPADPAKYSKSGLSNDEAEALKYRLINFMQKEKPYLDNELTLQKLAARLGLTPHNLSEVINSRVHLSYYDFINGYRLEEFKARLADPANKHYNLLSIAFDSGFKSKGTFNAIFKKQVGMTPSQYKTTL